MVRMANNFLSRIYDTRLLKKVELKSELQNHQFGGRLTKGDTFFIGDNGKERFFLTIYGSDGSMELWVKRQIKSSSSISEETICTLTDYEVNCINQIFFSALSSLSSLPTIPDESMPEPLPQATSGSSKDSSTSF